MSNKGSRGRLKLHDKEHLNGDSKSEGEKSRLDSKLNDSYNTNRHPKGGYDKSPQRGRDRNHNSREPKGPYRGREKDERSGVVKRRDSDKPPSGRGGRIQLARNLQYDDGVSPGSRGSSAPKASERDTRKDARSSESRKPDGKAFIDDSRLSKLVRMITREDDRERKINNLRLLRDFILLPENNKALSRSSDNLLAFLLDILHDSQTCLDAKQGAVRCIGAIGNMLGTEANRYIQWLFSKLTSAPTDEAKILLLNALLYTLKADEEVGRMTGMMPLVMTNSQSVLENADLPELLTAVVDIILHVTRNYPDVFGSHFKDTVDILVGWHIDATQKEAITQYTSDALVTFQKYWTADMTFSMTLLGQFLEDMEAYAEDLVLGLAGQTGGDEQIPPPRECVTKIAALLRVFTTVIRSLGDHFTPTHSPTHVTATYIIEMLERIVKCVKGTMNNYYCEKVLSAANQCLLLMITDLGEDALKASDSLLPFLVWEAQTTHRVSEHFINTLFAVILKEIELVNTQLPVSFITDLLATNSLLLKLRFSHSTQVLNHLQSVIHALVALKSVPLMEEAYRHILGDLEIGFNMLIQNLGGEIPLSLVATNPYPGVTYTEQRAEAVIIFNICAVAEIGNTKNNLIGMWALSPSVFTLLTQFLLPLHQEVQRHYPAVQYACLQTLYSHCSRHGHFISSSQLLSGNTDSSMLANSATGGHLGTSLALLSELISSPHLPHDSRCLCIKWAQEVIEMLAATPLVYAAKPFVDLMQALVTLGFNSSVEENQWACSCLQLYLSSTTNHPYKLLNRIVSLGITQTSHTNVNLRAAYMDLLKLVPINMITRMILLPNEEESGHLATSGGIACDAPAIWRLRHTLLAKPPTGTFHSHNFRSVMAYILHNSQPSKLIGPGWVERLYHSCQHVGLDKDRQDELLRISNMMEGNGALLWLWATWQAAQFCVMAKLRTPLGKPQDTFTTIESFIKKYAADVRNREADDTKPHADDSKEGALSWSFQNRLRVGLLLIFMEHLEKLLYNGYEGCASAIAAPPKAVKTFFRTNRGTCQEWLMRVRLNLVLIGLHNGYPALALRHSFELLRDMKETNNTQLEEFEQVVVYAVRALIELRCPDAIIGLYMWCRDVINKKMTWIKVAADVALGKYETAVKELKSVLHNYIMPSSPLEETKETTVESSTMSPSHSPKTLVDGFQKMTLLSKRSPPPDAGPDPVVTNFMVEQVCDSYVQLRDWQEVLEWQEQVQQYRSEATGSTLNKAFYMHADINYIRALSQFDDGDFESVREHLELVPGGSLSDINKETASIMLDAGWGTDDIMHAAQKQFVRAVTLTHTADDWKQQMASVVQCLQQSQRLCEAILRSAAIQGCTKISQSAVMLLSAASIFKQQLTSTSKSKSSMLKICDDMKLDTEAHDIGALLDGLRFLHLQQSTQDDLELENNLDFNPVISQVHLSAARLARKTSNLQLAEHLLSQESSLITKTEHESLMDAVRTLRSGNGVFDALKVMPLERETAKVLHCKGQIHEAVELLSHSVWSHTKANISNKASHPGHQMASRSLLTLIRWLQADNGKLLTTVTSQLRGSGDDSEPAGLVQSVQLLTELEKTLEHSAGPGSTGDPDDMMIEIVENPVLPEGDVLVGRLLHLSTHQCGNLAKSWFALASWCYKWGRKAIDNACQGCVELSTDEKAAILELLPKGTNNEEIESVLTILSQVHAGISSEEDISDQDASLYDDGAETTRRQLLASCMSLQIASDDCVGRLLDVWQSIVHRVYHYYKICAKAYFTYLTLNAQEENGSEDGATTATLRLLRLLVKHAWELRDVLEDGLAHTPTSPWKGIIPQLFSRLNHPEAYVRQSVSDLLCRVAQDAPHLIVYPAVVGASTSMADVKDCARDGLLNDYLAESESGINLDDDGDEMGSGGDDIDVALTDDDPGQTMLRGCFLAIVDTLAHQNPTMISEVELLVSELRRITLLWDELWLGTLNQHHQDVTRRLAQLENEIKKVNSNKALDADEKASIIKQKHCTILKPTLYTMERVDEITSQPAQTPHEKWFQDTYGTVIKEALQRLVDPPNPSHPHLSWSPFKQFHRSLQDRAGKRNSLFLSMEQISAKLSQLSHTVIAMPGISSASQVVTVESIYNTVQILPTKTKPKKLVFIGSDGKKYPYLFKGLEDLHLDERVMQFLSIVNNMFAKSNRGGRRLYHARHYSVTPLGARSGLIQWVEGATPLFSLYKRWQQRETLVQQMKSQQSSVSGSTPTPAVPLPAIPRPSEVFYGKLTPALKEKGITTTDNRKEWPIGVMRHVLQELIDETPTDLLAKELWCSSTTADEWWGITQTYTRSTAVMSMIGYIIGLGDRHLDNVLVDLMTGEVVHIDYNVCFEKGKGLRVPEKVPFRMTQNIESALGVTGIEGIFRLSCEHVIRTMRRGRETLLTLLETFVYDPLVDWTTGNEGGYTGSVYGGGQAAPPGGGSVYQSKRAMQKEITVNMFAIRVAEMKATWFSNRDEMLGSLPSLQQCLMSRVDAENRVQENVSQLEKNGHLHEYLQQAQTTDGHPLYELVHRFEEYAVIQSNRREVEEAIQTKLNECEQWNKAHQYALQSVQGGKLQQLCADLSTNFPVSLGSFAPVHEFLQGAGQGQVVAQCEQADNDLSLIVHQRRTVLHSCLDALRTYATIITQLPASYVSESRSIRMENWLQALICDFSMNKCKDIVSEFQDAYGLTAAPHPGLPHMLDIDTKLNTIINETNTRLVKVLERRSSENPMETSLLTLQTQEDMNQVHLFIKDGGEAGLRCMTSVIITTLCSLSKRYLIMEGAAAAAGDRLMSLTSREGDWFLDELCSISANVTYLLGIVDEADKDVLFTSDKRHQISSIIQTTNMVYVALQDLNINFRSIILPEAQKLLQQQEPSTLAAIATLSDLVTAADQPLEVMVARLEVLLRKAIMGMEQTDGELMMTVQQMRSGFDALLRGPDNGDPSLLTPGQMLLMGFHGLFTRLDGEMMTMLEAMQGLPVPDNWKKVDRVTEARQLQMTAFNPSTMGLLSAMFFLKQIKVMREFFHLCQQTADTMHNVTSGPVYDENQMSRPIKHFIAEYVRRQLLGFPSQMLGNMLCLYLEVLHIDVTAEIELRDIGAESKVSLDDLCKKAVDLGIKTGAFTAAQYGTASALLGLMDTAWRKADICRRLDENAKQQRASLQRAQLLLSGFQWLHEEALSKTGHPFSQTIVPPRTSILAELQKGAQALMSYEPAVAEIQERHHVLESSIIQRLKWAAGANPSLAVTLSAFEEALLARNNLLQKESLVSGDVIPICNAILHFEALRTRTPDAMSADTAFLQLINRCEEACLLIESSDCTVSEMEEKILNMQALTHGITPEWIVAVLQKANEEKVALTARQTQLQDGVEESKETVKSKVSQIQTILATHHKLMSDVRSILKTMAKEEEHELGPDVVPGGIRQYVNLYKTFSENLTTTLKLVLADEFGPDMLKEVNAMVATLNQQIHMIYDDLVNFAPPLHMLNQKNVAVTDHSDAETAGPANALKKADSAFLLASPRRIPQLQRSEAVTGSTPPSCSSPTLPLPRVSVSVTRKMDIKIARDPRTGKAIQERNSYAVGVWRRVKLKLDGRDPDMNKRFSVNEQVDYVIKEAKNPDNLAVLYEGWTPWV